jgi:hypothetical protein
MVYFSMALAYDRGDTAHPAGVCTGEGNLNGIQDSDLSSGSKVPEELEQRRGKDYQRPFH